MSKPTSNNTSKQNNSGMVVGGIEIKNNSAQNDIEYVTAYDVSVRKNYIKSKHIGPNTNNFDNFKDLEKKYNNIKLLYQYVMKKDMIATCIWFLLAGFLVINVTQDTISSIECQFNADQLREISERQSA